MVIDILAEIINTCESNETEDLFVSTSFNRRILKRSYNNGYLLIIQDRFIGKGYVLFYFSFFFNNNIDHKLQFVIKGEEVNQESILDKTWLHIQKDKKFFLIPSLPIVRHWNNKKQIIDEKTDYYTRFENQRVIFDVQLFSDESFELIVLDVPNQGFLSLQSIYKNSMKKYTLTGPWVVVSPLLDCWRVMVDGRIYEYREGPSREASARFSSQQAALFLYKLIAIQDDCPRDLVEIIKDEIAYSVMLDLGADGRWVHGCWTDQMETHARFQVDGIHLLLDHFNETKEDIFLEKALIAMKYLISIADTLNNGSLWFIHDTLELNQPYIYPLMKSRAFGKSLTNTLCLNTHLSTLCALIRIYKQIRIQELKTSMEKGLEAAEMVMRAEPATILYQILYYLIDLSFAGSYSTDIKSPWLARLSKILVRDNLELVLPYLKKAFPRFIMPNGFTTRHLAITHEAYHYHIINLYDMLVLYQLLYLHKYRDLRWLWHRIEKGVNYCLNGNLIKYLIRNRDKFIPQLVEVLIIYSAFNSSFDKKILVDLILMLADYGYKLTSGSYGFDNLITPEAYQVSETKISVSSPSIEVINTSLRADKKRELLIINTGSKNEQIEIASGNGNPMEAEIELFSSKKEKIPYSLDHTILPRDYMAIIIHPHPNPSPFVGGGYFQEQT